MARLLADENVPRAALEKRILVTFDRDFGRLIYHAQAHLPRESSCCGSHPPPEEPGDIVSEILERPGLQVRDRCTLVYREQIRQQALPEAEGRS